MLDLPLPTKPEWDVTVSEKTDHVAIQFHYHPGFKVLEDIKPSKDSEKFGYALDPIVAPKTYNLQCNRDFPLFHLDVPAMVKVSLVVDIVAECLEKHKLAVLRLYLE